MKKNDILSGENNIFETERLLIEPLLKHHAKDLFDLLSDDNLYYFMPENPPVSILKLEERYSRLETRCSTDKSEIWLNYALKLKESGEYIGRIEATVKNDDGYIAYIIGTNFQNKGFATESVKKLLEILKTEFNAKTASANLDTTNIASIKLLEKLLFERKKEIKNADFFKGRNSDEYVYEKNLT